MTPSILKLTTVKQIVLLPMKRFFPILLVAFIPGLTSGIENFESLKIIQTTIPRYPLRLTQMGLYEGSVQLMIAVNYLGELEDVFVEAYTHEDFAEIAEESVREWKYIPAKLNGEPMTVIKSLDFRFEDRTGIHSVDVMAAVADKLGFYKRMGHKRVYSPEELDSIPEPIEIVQPQYPQEFKDEGVVGEVRVLFYIDEQGAVRVPHVTEYTHEEFAEVALLAVSQWKFNPPMRNGRPVSILVSQPFNFLGDKQE